MGSIQYREKIIEAIKKEIKVLDSYIIEEDFLIMRLPHNFNFCISINEISMMEFQKFSEDYVVRVIIDRIKNGYLKATLLVNND